MAQDFDLTPGNTVVGQSGGSIRWLKVSARGTPGNADTGFSGFVLELNAAGTTTMVYFWPDTNGKLRYGQTIPTVATQNSAGTAIGS
jgi:hypothetical protein